MYKIMEIQIDKYVASMKKVSKMKIRIRPCLLA